MAHPILRVLKHEGRSTVWLGRQVRRHPKYLSQVFNERVPATAELRAECARALGMAEQDLFLNSGSSAPLMGASVRAGTAAVTPGYSLQEGPSIRVSA